MPELHGQRYNDPEHFKHVLDHLFTPALAKANYATIPPTASGSDLIHAEIIKNLEECSLVLCDISTLNANVFFELGIRTSLDRPVVLVRDNFTTQLPFDTGSINTYTYEASLPVWTLNNQIEALSAHITEAAKRSDGRNSLWRYFGLTQRAKPAEIANPTEGKLDLLLSEVNRIAKQIETGNSLPSRSIQADTVEPTVKLQYSPDLADDTAASIAAKLQAGSLSSDVPSKFSRFVRQATERIQKNGAKVTVGFDPDDDVIAMTTGIYVITTQTASEIAGLARRSSLRYVLRFNSI